MELLTNIFCIFIQNSTYHHEINTLKSWESGCHVALFNQTWIILSNNNIVISSVFYTYVFRVFDLVIKLTKSSSKTCIISSCFLILQYGLFLFSLHIAQNHSAPVSEKEMHNPSYKVSSQNWFPIHYEQEWVSVYLKCAVTGPSLILQSRAWFPSSRFTGCTFEQAAYANNWASAAFSKKYAR